MLGIIYGIPGAGKTLLLTHILNVYCYDRPQFLLMKKEIEKLNKGGFNLTIPEHPCFSSYSIEFRKFGRNRRQNYHFDPFKFGFESKFIDTVPTVPYGVYGIMEAQEFFNSRMSQYFPDNVSRAFEQHRHNGLTFFMDTQRPDLIDLNIRALACFLEVKDLIITHDKYTGKIKEICWLIHYIPNHKLFERYESSGGLDTSTYTPLYVVAEYDVFKLYDSRSNKPKFYSSLLNKDFELKKGEITGNTISAFEKFLENYSNIRPDNYYVKRSSLV